MKHATEQALDKLEGLLAQIREINRQGLREKKRGTFYLKASALLHFHEDPVGLFADLKIGSEFARFEVTTPAQQKRFLEEFHRVLAELDKQRG